MSREFFESISGEGVMLDPCATQAHWQNGIAERAIKTIFECAKSLHKDHDTDLETAVHQSVEAHNTVERVDGYSPTQWAFGRDNNWSGTLTIWPFLGFFWSHVEASEGHRKRNGAKGNPHCFLYVLELRCPFGGGLGGAPRPLGHVLERYRLGPLRARWKQS